MPAANDSPTLPTQAHFASDNMEDTFTNTLIRSLSSVSLTGELPSSVAATIQAPAVTAFPDGGLPRRRIRQPSILGRGTRRTPRAPRAPPSSRASSPGQGSGNVNAQNGGFTAGSNSYMYAPAAQIEEETSDEEEPIAVAYEFVNPTFGESAVNGSAAITNGLSGNAITTNGINGRAATTNGINGNAVTTNGINGNATTNGINGRAVTTNGINENTFTNGYTTSRFCNCPTNTAYNAETGACHVCLRVRIDHACTCSPDILRRNDTMISGTVICGICRRGKGAATNAAHRATPRPRGAHCPRRRGGRVL